MSNWTHVAGIIRINDIFRDKYIDFDKLIGKECLFESEMDIWNDAERNPKDYLPMGWEGSLEKSVWINPEEDCVPAYTVSIFGDLRGDDNPQAIVDWFADKCKLINDCDYGCWVRQATITVHNEYNGTVNWTYKREEEDGTV